MAWNKLTSVSRLRANGLRVLCSACGREARHFFHVRLRDAESLCCGARYFPKWHLNRTITGDYKHPNMAARAHALRATEKQRLGLF